ncbi:transcriptional regulator ATRX-like isoform X1 [Cataglyphis hispanica]|uniref:transcriptional regulator ATRX-like isoform X1 n=1 Tax=Cataglyphis hispanica TaxID=1086592 RepID=UPI0021801F91|nr:transcriptional regulator ATRX-like isoform X1 [Cataglyphis hispanica]
MPSKKEVKATAQELAYREKHFHDIRVVKDKQIACTSCGNELSIESKKIFSHPLMGILQCETCWNNFKEVYAAFEDEDEDEYQKYCYMCGDDKKLYECGDKDCVSAFCKKCIKRNATMSLLNAEEKDWKCFICDPKPIWNLRAICAAVMDTFKKGNRRNTNKIERRTLPSDIQKLKRAKEVQKSMRMLCDSEESGTSSDDKTFVTMRSRQRLDNRRHLKQKEDLNGQKEIEEVNLTDSSENENLFNTSTNLTSYKQNKQKKSRGDQKTKSIQDRRISKNKISSDSDNSSIHLSFNKTKQKRISKSIRTGKNINSYNSINFFDSESDEDVSTNKAPNISKSLSKKTTQDRKKDVNSSDAKSTKDKAKKHHDSASESEDEDISKEQNSKRFNNNEEEKRKKKYDKSSKKHLSNIQKDESDASSSKEFQKIKLQKVNHNKYSMRRLADLEIDYTKSPIEENSAIESKENINDQLDMNLDNAKEFVSDCKEIVLNLQTYINSVEQLYGKKDEEKFMLKMIKKINKLWPSLQKVQKNLTTFYQVKSSQKRKSLAIRRLPKEVNDDEQSSEKINVREKRAMSENKICNSGNEQAGSKNVSECDSEIFSGDESRTLQKMQIIQNKIDTSNTENNVNVNNTESDDGDKELIDSSRDEDNVDKNNMDLQNNLSSSPVLSVSIEKKKKSAERPTTKQLFSKINNNETPLTDKDNDSNDKQAKSDTDVPGSEIEIEDSPLRNGNRKMMTQNIEQDDSANLKDIINESMDLFDTSYHDASKDAEENETEAQEMAAETNCDDPKSLSKIKSLDISLQGGILNEKDRTSFSLCDNEEENLLDQDNQKKLASVSATSEKIHNNLEELDISEKTNTDDIESLDDAEALAKKSLLESDSDLDNILDVNVAKSIEGLIIDDVDQSGKSNEAKDDDVDVNSTSTLILSSFLKKMNTNIETKVEVENKKDNQQTDEKSREETGSLNDDAKAEEAAKKVLLESNSDDSTILSSDSEENENKKTESNSSRENDKSKQALLASSNTESSSSEPTILNVEVASRLSKKSNNSKRNHELESDGDSVISRMKRKRVKLNKNHHHWNDKKLKMFCEVRLKRLSRKELRRYSYALQKSREYLEQKKLKSLVNLDNLEKKRKKNTKKDSEDSSMDDDTSSKTSKSLNKRKEKQITKEESLMDYLKKIENGDVSVDAEMDSGSDESIHRIENVDSVPISNEALISEANRIAKENLLNSSDSNEKEVIPLDSDDDINSDDKNEKAEEKEKKYDKKSEEKISKQDDDKKEKNNKSNWRRNKLLTMKLSDTDSDAEKQKWDKKQEKMKKLEGNNSDSDNEEKQICKKKKTRRRIIDSDSDVRITDVSIDSDNSLSAKENSNDDAEKEKEKLRRKRRKRGESNSSGTDSSLTEKPKPKRKRIKKVASDSDSSVAEINNSQESTPGKNGRKNIRKVLKDKQVAEDTKLAAKEEEERLKRIAERQAVYNEMYEMRLAGEEKVEKLVLDFDTETKKELVSVHEELVKRLKPHQAQGIKFMWDACFESLERVKTTSGSGCIIAHCMGLGKTLQVIALTHTLLSHEATGVKTVLIVCPLSTVLNWLNEYRTWLNDLDDIEVYELTKFKKNFERKQQLQRWQKTGGVMIIGYEMFRNLTGANKNIRKGMKEVIEECLVDPGADLVVCDEGHLLKKEDTALSKCMRRVRTLRRIVLTGTPLQNNLIEYHCMVQFVKPNLLGTKKEFLNRFVNPITNGQFDDSTAYDVKLMKKRAHVLHKMLEGSVQRFDYSVLTPFLPPKQEYVIFVRLTDPQIKMYQYYLENLARRSSGAGGTLFADFQALQRIWTHPLVLRLNAEKIEKANEKKELLSESEGSLKDFIHDSSDSERSSSSSSSSDSDVEAIDDAKENTNISKRRTRNNPGEEESEEEVEEETREAEWWSQFVQPEHFEDMRVSAKLLLFFGILNECEQIGDKVLLFSQSLYSLTLIEEFLRKIDDQTQNDTSLETLDNHTGSWSLGLDYFRLDGQTSAENRNMWCKIFNKPSNTRARLFLISTRAGGLGINLTAANRVIIFDASWNPSHDVQSIFRIYRFGQKKPCYVYRFLAAGTMEEKIYNRQVTKLSLSCRVVDEQQIERHYSNHNLNELYSFEGYSDAEKPTLNLPKDRLLAEIFLKYKDVVENYHEHDSLLENKAEEELDEEERKQAWLEYEEEKKGRPPMNPMLNVAYQNNMLLQQYNMMMNSGQTGLIPQDMALHFEYENLQQLIRKDYPNATPEQQKIMTNRALMEMYNYWEKQATLSYSKQPIQRNPATTSNFQQRPMIVPHAASNSNTNQQVSQLNQLLTSSGQSGNYINVNKSAQPNMAKRGDLLPNPFTYQNTLSNNNAGGKTNDDIIEVIPTTSNAGVSNVQGAIQPTNNNKNQEE